MAGLKSLVGLAFAGSIGMTLLILACALPNSWWPFFVLIFYLLAAVPTVVANKAMMASGGHSSYMDPAVFLTMGCIVSAFALPIVLARAPQNIITTSACYLTLAGNIVVFLTIFGFFIIFYQDDAEYMW